MKPFCRNRETILKQTGRTSLIIRDAEGVREASHEPLNSFSGSQYPFEDRGRRAGGWHRGGGVRHLGPERRGLQPDRPGRESRQASGRHQLEHFDGPLKRYCRHWNKNGRLKGGLFVCSSSRKINVKPLKNGARDGTRTRGLRRDRAAL